MQKPVALVVIGIAVIAPALSRPLCTRQQTGDARINCDAQRALLIVGQQVEEARTVDNASKQLPVLIRAAELLWPRQQKQARNLFTSAFDLAERRFKEKGDETRLEGNVIVEAQDMRFDVMEAIARRRGVGQTTGRAREQ